ncbi:hypothetical protein CHUAL_013548 [Chamberlinius hualienensis]
MSLIARHVDKKWQIFSKVLSVSNPLPFHLNKNGIVYSQKRSRSSKKLSYVHGAGTVPLIGTTVGQFVDEAAEKFGNDEAFVDCFFEIRKTFHQYVEDINNFATGLLSLGLQRSDRVGIWAPNRYEWLVAQYGATKAGLIVVSLSPAYKTAEFEYALQLVQLKAVIAPPTFFIQEYYQMAAEVIPELQSAKYGTKIKSKKHPYFEMFISMSDDEQLNGTFKFSDVLKAGGSSEKKQLEELQDKIQISDTNCIMFTSGTTGKPKAAMISHHSLINGSYIMGNKPIALQSRRLCAIVPFFHVFGYVALSFSGVLGGRCIVVPHPLFNAGSILETIQKEKCTSIYGTPTMFVDILNHPDCSKTDLSSLCQGGTSGAPCPPALIKRFTDEIKIQEYNTGYGMTELAGGAFNTLSDDSVETKATTVGKVYDFLEAKLTDPSTGDIVPIGTPGEICVKGYKVMKGYWNDEAATKEAIRDGWLHTGDIGILDENGNLTVVDRIKDLIIRGGENIYPKEIEDFFMTHPKISEAHAFGIPDERMGEEVCIWIMPRPNETMTKEDVDKHCKGKISHFKIPRYVHFVEDFPKTISGKVKKFEMRETMKEILTNQKSK